MKLTPRDVWIQALSGGLQATFLDTLTGYRVIEGRNPDYFLVPEWMFLLAQLCLEEPRFGGIALVPYDTPEVSAIGTQLPDGRLVADVPYEEFAEAMALSFGRLLGADKKGWDGRGKLRLPQDTSALLEQGKHVHEAHVFLNGKLVTHVHACDEAAGWVMTIKYDGMEKLEVTRRGEIVIRFPGEEGYEDAETPA